MQYQNRQHINQKEDYIMYEADSKRLLFSIQWSRKVKSIKYSFFPFL